MAGSSRLTEYSIDSTLLRGSACAFCRRRKMRCDGQRPVCGQCLRGSRPDDCEYIDSQARSRAEMLEEDINRIENRIYELEHPTESSGKSVSLHHPYRQPHRQDQMLNVSQVIHPQRLSSTASAPAPSAAESSWSSSEPPINIIETLLDAFLPYACDWGFFLDPVHFRRDVLLPLTIGHHSRPSPPLLSAVYLVGIVLSDSPTLKMYEQTVLARVLSSLPVSLSGLHPRKAVHALQTEILLANYFYALGRFLEGRYHSTAAVSLVVSTIISKTEPSVVALWPSTAEKLDACWTTISLDKSWAVALAMHPGVEMLDLQLPADDAPVEPTTGSHFLEGTELSSHSASAKRLIANATILWEQANKLVVSWKPDMRQSASIEFFSAFNTLDVRIREFTSELAASIAPTPNVRLLLVGRSIALSAMIQLHRTIAQTNPESRQKCLDAAKAILTLIAGADLRKSMFINPIVGVTWVTACEVVVHEISALRVTRSMWLVDVPSAVEAALVGISALRVTRSMWLADVPSAVEAALVGLVDNGIDAMRRFEAWPVMKYYLAKIERVYSAAEACQGSMYNLV